MTAFRWVLFVLIALCTATAQQRVESADQTGVLTLPDGSKFKTLIYGMKIIGQLRTAKKMPYFILSGTTCTECDENISIYIHSPSDGPMKNEGEQPRFSYPGQETDYQSGKIDYEGQMFYGDCLRSHPNAAVWFAKAIGDDKKWHDGVLVAEVKGDRLVTTELRLELPQKREAQAAVRAGQCHELPGIKSYSEP
jgi:hypothetical protein